MKIQMKMLGAVLAAVLGVQAAHAGVDIKDSKKTIVPATTEDTYATGLEIGVFGGAAISDTNGFKTQSASGATSSQKFSSQVGGAAGVKVGYTWSDFSFSKAAPVTGDFAVLPAVDAEFYWTGIKEKSSGTVVFQGTHGIKSSQQLDAYVFTIDPKLKFQIGRFRPYVGFGVGGAYLDGGSLNTVTSTGTTYRTNRGEADGDFVVQGLAGVQVFVTKNWSLDVDYKYVDFIDTNAKNTVSSGIGQNKFSADNIGEHVITAGVSYHF